MKRCCFVVVSLLLAAPLWGAISQHATINSVDSVTTDTSHQSAVFATTTGDTIIVTLGFGAGGSASSSVTDLVGNTFTKCTACSNANTVTQEVWYVLSSSGTNASNKVTVNYSAGSKFVAVITSYSGVVALGVTTATTSGAANPSVNLTTQDSNNFCIAGFATPNTTTSTIATGTLVGTQGSSSTNPITVTQARNTVVSPGTCTVAINNTSTTWAIGQIELRTSSGASTFVPQVGGFMVGP